MTISEYDAYMATMNELEERIENDNKYPVIEDNKIQKCCKFTVELSNYLTDTFNTRMAPKKMFNTIPEDKEPKTVKLNE